MKPGGDHENPIVWAIGGSDSGAGAGIQADLKTITALGAYACTVITAVTAQNTEGVRSISPLSKESVAAQLAALEEDLPARAIKTGMLWSSENVRILRRFLAKSGRSERRPFVVCDPVMVSSSGHALHRPDLIRHLISDLIPLSDLLTPNIPEATALCNLDFKQDDASDGSAAWSKSKAHTLAQTLLEMGAKAVLIKGGHAAGDYSQDFFSDGTTRFWITSPRHATRNNHGTGCTLASAIAACLALDYSLVDSIVIAKAFVNHSLRSSPRIGNGNGPLGRASFPPVPIDMPWITATAEEGRARPSFPDIAEPIGFYPIVDSSRWVERLASSGVRSIQLRIKTGSEHECRGMPPPEIEAEIARSISIARAHHCRLFINDFWACAIKYGAYGVHLGQTDLLTADVKTIAASGLRLGVSTHSFEEIARALAVRPSYIAVGPVFPTTTKDMPFKPFGVEGLARWRKTIDCQMVAIGGIELNAALPLIKSGADGIAVVRDIKEASDPLRRAGQWLSAMPV